MCKITFQHIIQENALRRGLFQLNDHAEDSFTQNKNFSTDNSDNSSQVQTFEEAKAQKSQQIKNEIEKWFTDRSVFLGNPEELIHGYLERQKAIILPKKEGFAGLSANKLRMNNLLSRRTAKLLEVNVSG